MGRCCSLACPRLIRYGKSVGIYGISRAVQLRLTVLGVFAVRSYAETRGEIPRIKTARGESLKAAIQVSVGYDILQEIEIKFLARLVPSKRRERVNRVIYVCMYICILRRKLRYAMSHVLMKLGFLL